MRSFFKSTWTGIGACLIIGFSFFQNSVLAQASLAVPDECEMNPLRGGGDALPWGQELKLPWSDLEGYWGTLGKKNVILHIDINKKYRDGSRQVQIEMLDPANGTVMAVGSTLVSKDARVMRGTLYGQDNTWKIRIASYVLDSTKCGPRVILVASIYEEEAGGLDLIKKNTYLIQKISTLLKSKNRTAHRQDRTGPVN